MNHDKKPEGRNRRKSVSALLRDLLIFCRGADICGGFSDYIRIPGMSKGAHRYTILFNDKHR